MNILQTHTNVKFFLDKLSTGAVPSTTNEGIDLALNDTIEEFIKEKYRAVPELILRKNGFESIQKRIDDLRNLVIADKLVTLVDTTDYLTLDLTTLNPKYQFYLRGSVQIGDANGKFRGIQIVKQDNIDVIDYDPFNQSIARRPKAFFAGNTLYIKKVSDGTSLFTKAKLTYLKRFTEVSLTGGIDIELAEHTHREIVKMCVHKMLEVIESPRVQTSKEQVIGSE